MICFKCPECDGDIIFRDNIYLLEDDLINCPSCGIDLVLKNDGEWISYLQEGEDWGE